MLDAQNSPGNVTQFEYNDVNLLTATVGPLGNRTEQTYDAARLHALATGGNGTTIIYLDGREARYRLYAADLMA